MKPRERSLIYGLLILVLAANVLILASMTGRTAHADANIRWDDHSIGFVHVQDVVEKLMVRPQYQDDREQLTEEINTAEAQWRERFDALRQQYADVQSANDPRFAEAQAAMGALQREFQQWQQTASSRVNTMAVEQLQAAYQEVLAAINVVADEKGIDIVWRFTPVSADLPAEQHAQTMLDIRMRPVLRYPEELDMTADVLAELGLVSE